MNFTISNADDVAIAYSSGILRHFKWNSDPVQLVRTWKSIHNGPIARMAFDPTEGQLLATGGCDSTVKIWDVVRLYCTHNLKGAVGVITAITFQPQPDGDRYNVLAAGDQDYKICVWNLITNQQLAKLEGHSSAITAIKYFPNDAKHRRVISASRDKTVIIWSLDKYAALKKFPVFEAIEGLAFVSELATRVIGSEEPCGAAFVTAGETGMIKLWNADTGALLFKQKSAILGRTDDSGAPSVTQLILCQSSQELALTTPENNILFYSFQNAKFDLIRQLVGHVDEVLCVRFLGREQKHLIVATNSAVLKIFEITSLSCTIVEGHDDIVLNVEVFKSNRDMFATTSKDNTIRIWSFSAETMTATCLYRGAGHSHSVTSLALPSHSSSFAITGSEDTTMKVWRIPKSHDGKGVQTLNTISNTRAHEKDINSIAVAPNDKIICSASQDKTGKLWTLTTKSSSAVLEFNGTLRGHRRGIWCAAFSSVDQVVATGSADASIKIWAIVDCSCLKTLQGHDCSVLSLMFCTRGMQVASVASDGNLKLWSVKSGECVATIDAHNDKTWSLDANESEQLFVTGAADSRVVVWRDTTQQELEDEARQRDSNVEATQELMNCMQSRKWMKALKYAIRLEQPFRALNVLKEMLLEEDDESVVTSLTAMRDDQLIALLKMAVNWNKNSKHATAAQIVIKSALTKLDPNEILEQDAAKELLASLIPYCERHLARTDRLLQQATFLEFVWASMKLKELPVVDDAQSIPAAASGDT